MFCAKVVYFSLTYKLFSSKNHLKQPRHHLRLARICLQPIQSQNNLVQFAVRLGKVGEQQVEVFAVKRGKRRALREVFFTNVENFLRMCRDDVHIVFTSIAGRDDVHIVFTAIIIGN